VLVTTPSSTKSLPWPLPGSPSGSLGAITDTQWRLSSTKASLPHVPQLFNCLCMLSWFVLCACLSSLACVPTTCLLAPEWAQPDPFQFFNPPDWIVPR
jgi:hypothetical protein